MAPKNKMMLVRLKNSLTSLAVTAAPPDISWFLLWPSRVVQRVNGVAGSLIIAGLETARAGSLPRAQAPAPSRLPARLRSALALGDFPLLIPCVVFLQELRKSGMDRHVRSRLDAADLHADEVFRHWRETGLCLGQLVAVLIERADQFVDDVFGHVCAHVVTEQDRHALVFLVTDILREDTRVDRTDAEPDSLQFLDF